MIIEYVATCLFGLEKTLGDEIEALGYKRLETMDGRVTFSGGLDAVPRCNINLRCAERVYIKLGRFPAGTFGELFDGTQQLHWEDWLSRDDAFPIKGHAIKSRLFSLPDCQSIVKKAVAKRLEDEYGLSWFPETRVKYQIEFFIFKDVATIMIDTTGMPLHKRGYRPQTTAAPLRETLAAALVYNSRPRENVLLWDPFCGSGTIAIEAAMMMTGRAPGLSRSFAAEEYDQFPPELWSLARDEAVSKIDRSSKYIAFASDINPKCIEIAAAAVKRAGVEGCVRTFVADALDIKPNGMRGTVVCNPPYGERLGTVREAEELYRGIGRRFDALYPWQIYILTSCEYFERLYGRRADKVRKLYNGMIPCNLYQYFKPQKR